MANGCISTSAEVSNRKRENKETTRANRDIVNRDQ